MQEYGIRTVVVSNIEAEAAGVTVGDQYEWDEVQCSCSDTHLLDVLVCVGRWSVRVGSAWLSPACTRQCWPAEAAPLCGTFGQARQHGRPCARVSDLYLRAEHLRTPAAQFARQSPALAVNASRDPGNEVMLVVAGVAVVARH